MQFLFAFDRNHPRLQDRYDVLHPAVLVLIRDIAAKAARHGVPANLCGEMAGKPIEAMALIGAGFRSISMVPAAIGPVKSMVLALDCAKLESFLAPLLACSNHTLRPQLLRYAEENNIPV
jgi:phosphotransferase system enzyme I (PtsP)